MSKAKEAIQRARRTAGEAKADMAELGAGTVTAYLIGSMETSGAMAQIPQVLGLPRTLTLAVAAKLLAYNASGTIKQVANGAGNAALNVAIYQFAKGGAAAVTGIVGAGNAIHDRGRRLEAEARRLAASGGELSADEELDALEGIPVRAH